jgi:hypothetical protein
MPSFKLQPKAEAEGWARIIGLTPYFNGRGSIVIGQNPKFGDPMPANNVVNLYMAAFRRR